MARTESEIIEQARAGNVESLAEYLDYRKADLTAFILGKMGPALRGKVEAADVFQEVCRTAVQTVDQVDLSEYDLFGWFCALAKRRVVDAQRRFSAQKRASAREIGLHASGPDASQGGLINLLVASITSPSQAFSRDQREFRMLNALSQLPEAQQTVLRLRYVDGLPSKEIAEKIGKSDGATRVLITRSIKKLEKLVGEMDSE